MADPAPEPPLNPPDYIRYDKKQREEFLSQVGITAPAQREMFHQLCNSWRPLIDFDSFTAARAGVVTHPAQETENLLGRLKAAKMGLLTFRKNDKGERVPKDILLCSENQPRFWFYFVQDLIQQACDNPRNPFLSVSILRAREILLPAAEIADLPLERLAKASIEALAKTETLLFLNLQGERLLATSQTLTLLLTFASAKLRLTLKVPDVTAAASRLMNLSLSEVAKRLDDKESGFWRGLTEALLAKKEDWMADRRLHLDAAFFQAAELFYRYLTNQIEENKRQKAQAQEREADLREVEQIVLASPSVVLSPQQLDEHLRLLLKDKYGPDFEGLREEFLAAYTVPAQKTALAVLVVLQSGLIHRNNLYRYFLKRFEGLQGLLLQDYRQKMDRRLRKKGSGAELDFLDRENLERSLADWTAKTDPLVGELLDKSKILAEAIIHHGRTELNLLSVEEMRPLLERFFKPGVMTRKTYQEIWSLDVVKLYDESFKRLSVISQFWRRLTGTFQIQRDELSLLALPREKKSDPARAASGIEVDDTPLDNLSPEELKARKEEWKRRKSSALPSAKPSSKAAPEPAPKIIKQYSDGERDKAWKGFRETIKKD